jgi:hypothetical protein
MNVTEWNEKLLEATRGCVGGWQQTLVEAIEDLGHKSFPMLKANINDICWANKVIEQKKLVEKLRQNISDLIITEEDEVISKQLEMTKTEYRIWSREG